MENFFVFGPFVLRAASRSAPWALGKREMSYSRSWPTTCSRSWHQEEVAKVTWEESVGTPGLLRGTSWVHAIKEVFTVPVVLSE